MAADQIDNADGAGCVQYGCGIVGVLLAGIIVALSIIIPLSTSFSVLAVILVPPLALLLPGAVLGFAAGKLSWKPNTRRWLGRAGRYSLVFSLLCLVSAVALTFRPAGFEFEGEVPAGGGMIGPVEIDSAVTVDVEVQQDVNPGGGRQYQRWSFVTIELLDQEKEYLSSLGGEFWQYAGVDNEGYHWEEGDEIFEAVVRFPSPGTYYLRCETESNVEPSQLSPITVTLSEQARWGAPTPLQAAGYVSFFLGLILVTIRRNSPVDSVDLRSGAKVRFRDETWIVRDRTDYTYDEWKVEEWTLHSTEPGTQAPRYLEREYEDGTPYEAWFWSTPISLSDLECEEEESEEHVEAYVEVNDALPTLIAYEGERFRLNDSGTARRSDDSISYHIYKEIWNEDGDLSITIEGDPPTALSAVVTERISASDLQKVEKQDDAGSELAGDGDKQA